MFYLRGITTLLLACPLMVCAQALPPQMEAADPSEGAPIQMEDVQRFSNALSLIKQYYVTQTKDSALFDNAIRGMLVGLDPHSAYLDASDFKELQTTTMGEFGGLGLEVTMEEGAVKVITPLVDTPAFKAGIKSGDYIIKLGQTSVQGLDLKAAVNLMRGPVGTPLELTIVRKGATQPLLFNVMREKIEIKSVQNKLFERQYGYIRLTQFQAQTAKNMLEAIASLKQQTGGKLNGLILDLRNNPGGLLDSAIQISSAFLNKTKNGKPEIIVSTKGRLQSANFTAMATDKDILKNAPMVVLINNGSASASEIVAGALKDNHRAIILGTKSFGKGSVQTVLPLDGEHGIKLTTALYYTPAGTSIQAEGIRPDIVVEELAIANDKSKINPLAGFSESTLTGHLKNGNATTEKKTTVALTKTNPSNDEAKLLHEDYQLYAALTVLKGLSMAQR